jgi:Predicted nucleotide-binding protein containing TIR-like domain/Histidine-specific methyltransferase, SAM-dependent
MAGKNSAPGRRKVFLGSSTAAKAHVEKIAVWLADAGVEPVPWEEPQVLLPGLPTMRQLLNIAGEVAGAVFVFAEDDLMADGRVALPRDNVILEYGLFAGTLGEKNAIVIVVGNPKLPTDFSGVYVDLNKPEKARVQLREWVKRLRPREYPYASQIFPTYVDAAFATNHKHAARPEILSKINDELMIPTRYLYDNEFGTDHWFGLCDELSYRFFKDGLNFWRDNAHKIVAAIKSETGNAFDFVSLGPGDGQKDLQFIQACVEDEDLDVIYYPYDVSLRMISRTVQQLRDCVVPIKLRAILADFTQFPQIDSVFAARRVPKVISLLGNSLGNEPDERGLIKRFKAHMDVGDLLLLEVRLRGATDGPSEVNSTDARRFYFSPLEHYLAIPFHKDNVYAKRHEPPQSGIENTRSTMVYGRNVVYGKRKYPDAKLICINEYDKDSFVTTIEREGFSCVVDPLTDKNESFLVCLMRSEERKHTAAA